MAYNGTEIKSQAAPRVMNSPNVSRDTRVNVTIVARLLLLLSSVEQKCCRWEHGAFKGRNCVNSRS
jgi:hypothetical protein